MNFNLTRWGSAFATIISLSSCAQQSQPGLTMGTGNDILTGSAGGSVSANANKSLIRCPKTLGTLAVDDGRFRGTRSVTTVEPLIRLAVQQSNCFVMTAIGSARTSAILDRITGEQRNSGEYRVGSKQQKGQRVAADYLLDPQVVVNNEATSGQRSYGGGGLLGVVGSVAGLPALGTVGGALSNAMQSNTTVVALTLTDIRSTVQIGISEGSATANNMNSSIGGWGGLFLGVLAGGGGGTDTFTRTPEGQATAAAFFDAYNKMVQSLQNYKAQEVEGGLGRGGKLKVGD